MSACWFMYTCQSYCKYTGTMPGRIALCCSACMRACMQNNVHVPRCGRGRDMRVRYCYSCYSRGLINFERGARSARRFYEGMPFTKPPDRLKTEYFSWHCQYLSQSSLQCLEYFFFLSKSFYTFKKKIFLLIFYQSIGGNFWLHSRKK